MVYINNGEHDNPHELPKENSEGSLNTDKVVYTQTNLANKLLEEIEKLEYIYQHLANKLLEEIEKLKYIYQHFQDCEKIHEIDPHIPTEQIDDTLYPQINNYIKCGLFENVIDSYYLDNQIRGDFTCPKACYTHNNNNNTLDTRPQCTHTYDHISQQLDKLANMEQQHKLYTNEVIYK